MIALLTSIMIVHVDDEHEAAEMAIEMTRIIDDTFETNIVPKSIISHLGVSVQIVPEEFSKK